MKHIKLFASHADYASTTIEENPSVVYDGEHLHWSSVSSDETPEETPVTPEESTKYALNIYITDTDFGKISTYEYSFGENDTINENIEHLSIISSESTIYNADTNEELSNPTISVAQNTNGFAITGTMPAYNIKINISVSSLA